jgi:hypothetical protein
LDLAPQPAISLLNWTAAPRPEISLLKKELDRAPQPAIVAEK